MQIEAIEAATDSRSNQNFVAATAQRSSGGTAMATQIRAKHIGALACIAGGIFVPLLTVATPAPARPQCKGVESSVCKDTFDTPVTDVRVDGCSGQVIVRKPKPVSATCKKFLRQCTATPSGADTGTIFDFEPSSSPKVTEFICLDGQHGGCQECKNNCSGSLPAAREALIQHPGFASCRAAEKDYPCVLRNKRGDVVVDSDANNMSGDLVDDGRSKVTVFIREAQGQAAKVDILLRKFDSIAKWKIVQRREANGDEDHGDKYRLEVKGSRSAVSTSWAAQTAPYKLIFGKQGWSDATWDPVIDVDMATNNCRGKLLVFVWEKE